MLNGIKQRQRTAKIFIWSTAMIYFIATTHVSLGLYILLLRYVRHAGIPEAHTSWFTCRTWDGCSYNGLIGCTVWTFDLLLIYRCYIIWRKRWLIILAPVVLLVAALAIHVPMLIWLTYESPMSYAPYRLSTFVSLPLLFVQNVLTTGLICLRLARQHQASRAAGIQPSNSRLSLFHIVRIIIESAAIYPIMLLIGTLLWVIQSDKFVIFFGLYIPIIGIVSTLLTIRIHNATTRRSGKTTLFTLFPWMNNTGSSDERQPASSGSELTTFGVKSVPVESGSDMTHFGVKSLPAPASASASETQ